MGDFPGGPVVKNPPCNAGDASLIPAQGTKIPCATKQLSLHATSRESLHTAMKTQRGQKTFKINKVKLYIYVYISFKNPTFFKETQGEEMATHSSILPWTTPWTEEPQLLKLASSRARGSQQESVCCNERICMMQRRSCMPQLRPHAVK